MKVFHCGITDNTGLHEELGTPRIQSVSHSPVRAFIEILSGRLIVGWQAQCVTRSKPDNLIEIGR